MCLYSLSHRSRQKDAVTVDFEGERERELPMPTEKLAVSELQQPELSVKGSDSFHSQLSAVKDDRENDEASLTAFRAKEEQIEKKKMEVKERVRAQLGRVQEETKRLAEIRQELESLSDPATKEIAAVRKKIDSISRDLKPLGQACAKKEKEYKEVLEAYNEKNREKSQLINKLTELEADSEQLRMNKLEELNRSLESLLTRT